MVCKVLSLVLAALFLTGTACFASEYTIGMTMLEDEQAFLVSENVTYTNNTGARLTDVMFSVYSNCFRRESTLPYDNAALEAAFPESYAPSGTEIRGVYVNGETATWAVQGENECFIRVHCPLAAGESCTIRFEYTLLLSENCAFLGSGDADWRLMLCYPAVCAYEDGEFVTNATSRGGEWFYSEPSDFKVTLALAKGYEPAANGAISCSGGVYTIEAGNVREFALLVSRAFHSYSEGNITVYGQERLTLKKLLSESTEYVETLSGMLGELPTGSLTVVLSETAVSRVTPGLIALAQDDTDALPLYIACQWFMNSNPAVDPFLRSGVAEYASLLALKRIEGENAFSKALTDELLPHLSITIPGSLTPDTYLSRFTTRSDYETVVTMRGAAVVHELGVTMGEENLIAALKAYSESGANVQDFVECLSGAAGREMGEALVAWLYTIDEYVDAGLENYD